MVATLRNYKKIPRSVDRAVDDSKGRANLETHFSPLIIYVCGNVLATGVLLAECALATFSLRSKKSNFDSLG